MTQALYAHMNNKTIKKIFFKSVSIPIQIHFFLKFIFKDIDLPFTKRIFQEEILFYLYGTFLLNNRL
jgi:hypothetical protein